MRIGHESCMAVPAEQVAGCGMKVTIGRKPKVLNEGLRSCRIVVCAKVVLKVSNALQV